MLVHVTELQDSAPVKGLGEAVSFLCPSIVIQENLKFSVLLINIKHLNANILNTQMLNVCLCHLLSNTRRRHFSSTFSKFQIQQFLM